MMIGEDIKEGTVVYWFDCHTVLKGIISRIDKRCDYIEYCIDFNDGYRFLNPEGLYLSKKECIDSMIEFYSKWIKNDVEILNRLIDEKNNLKENE